MSEGFKTGVAASGGSPQRLAGQHMSRHCLTIGERLAKLPGDRGWELLYRPHPKLSDMSIKEAVDMGGWLDEIYALLEYEESLPSDKRSHG